MNTTTNERKSVDVLAVLDMRIALLESKWDALREPDDNGPEPPTLTEAREARAAVTDAFDVLRGARAELVAVNMREDGTQRTNTGAAIRIAQIDGVLARCGVTP